MSYDRRVASSLDKWEQFFEETPCAAQAGETVTGMTPERAAKQRRSDYHLLHRRGKFLTRATKWRLLNHSCFYDRPRPLLTRWHSWRNFWSARGIAFPKIAEHGKFTDR